MTASTSIVLISTLQAPNTVVLLSSIRYPGHIVGVRDTTGSTLIARYPVIVSTMSGITFYDGTSSLVLNQPNGFLSLSSRNPTTWQLLNSVGFLTSLSNAFVETLTTQTSYIGLTSTVNEFVSSMTAGSVTVTNEIQIEGQTNIQGNITIGGSFDILSSAHAFQDMFLSSGLIVGGTVAFPSSLSVRDNLLVRSNLSTIHDLGIRDELAIDKSLYVQGALLPRFLSVQTLTASEVLVGGGLLAAGGISTMNASVAQDAVFLGEGLLRSSIQVQTQTAIADSLSVRGAFTTSTLQVGGPVAVTQEAEVGSMRIAGALSSLSTLVVSGTSVLSGETLIQGSVEVTQMATVRKLDVLGYAYISSLAVYSTLFTKGDATSYGSTFVVTSDLNVRGSLGVGTSFSAPNAFVSISTGLSTLKDLTVFGNLVANGSVFVRQDGAYPGGLQAQPTFFTSSLSTTSLSSLGGITATGQVNVSSGFQVDGLTSASTLGAPFSLSISTLVLSNTLYVQSVGSVPELRMNDSPEKLFVGYPANPGGYDLYVQGTLQNRSSIIQTTYADYSKLWQANELRASTFAGLSNLSSAVIGPTNFTNPLLNTNALFVVGNTGTTTSIYAGLNQSTSFVTVAGSFAGGGRKIRYNGSDLWVAVGSAGTGGPASNSILSSRDGYTWAAAATGGFTGPTSIYGARDVVYGGGLWIAVGYTITGTNIQYSGNGRQWSNVTGTPFSGGGGDAIAYNGSNTWVAVGTTTSGQGIFYSFNGTTWTTPPAILGSPTQNFIGVGFGNGFWLATGLDRSSGQYNIYRGDSVTFWNFVSPPASNPIVSYQYNSSIGVWLGAAITQGPQTNSILIGQSNGSPWFAVTSGGFTQGCSEIITVPELSSFIAVGSNIGGTPSVFQYSVNGSTWVNNSLFLGSASGVAYGPARLPDLNPYFTANVATRFQSTLSSVTLNASTVKASSFTGSYLGDGSLLTQVGAYSPNIFTSSFSGRMVSTMEVSTATFVGSVTRALDSLFISRRNFFSSGNIYLGAGNDSLANGNVQTSVNGLNWTRSLDSNFEYYANDVAGNGVQADPFYVAVGADSRTLYTIQWSVNGLTWNPITSGGFSYATATGIREGLSVVYNTTLSRWVAIGRDTGGVNTIQYSSDGRNWSVASGGFTDFATKVKAAPSGFVAIGNGTKWSTDGITWLPSANGNTLTAIGYGFFNYPPLFLNAWVGIASNTLFFSLNSGQSWNTTGVLIGPVSFSDLVYTGSQWLAVGSNRIYRSLVQNTWFSVNTPFPSEVNFNSVAYNTNNNTAIAGASAVSSVLTLFRSTDLNNWSTATTGGFSTSVESFGIGYGIVSYGTSNFAVGKSAFDIETSVKPAIFEVSTIGALASVSTQVSLTNANGSNLFSSLVRAIGVAPDEFYKFVAVGDSLIPAKTIARSPDGSPGSWIPAVTGGFSTTGYGVTYNNGNWFAVGDAQASTNTIQYSPDSANWFGTAPGTGLRQGGRGISLGISTLYSTFVAVGKDTGLSTILRSQDGFTWTNTYGLNFNVQGNGVAGGLDYPSLPYPPATLSSMFLAVGQDTRGSHLTILKSYDGLSWNSTSATGFTGAGYGAVYAFDQKKWVVVGEDTDPEKTIQYSPSGGDTFLPVVNGFTKAGYAVTYNSTLSTFYAVGEDINGNSQFTLKLSTDGISWYNAESGSGFISQKNLGSAKGVYTQGVLNLETIPYMNFSNLIVYERTLPFLYPKQTIRLQSTFVSFNESLFVNLSSQVAIGAQNPYPGIDVSVYGDVYASSIIFPALTTTPTLISVSSFVVSTLSAITTLITSNLTTPSFAFNAPEQSKANVFSTTAYTPTNGPFIGELAINQTLFVYNVSPSVQYPQPIGIGIANSPGNDPFGNPNLNEVLVNGDFGVSSITTLQVYATSNIFISASQVYLKDEYLSIFEGTDASLVNSGNRIQTNPSSMTLNSILTLQVSTQCVGAFTTDPQQTLDIQRKALLRDTYFSTLTTSLLFLKLQSI